MLRSLGARYGFRAEKIDPVRYKDFVVSSTRIRRLVRKGASTRRARCSAITTSSTASSRAAPAAAARSVSRRRTSTRANELLPPAGVYATTIAIDGIVLPSITNIGVRPTFGDVDRPMIETHIFDLDRDLYGQTLRLSFVQRLRDERAFPDVDALRAQIEADCRSARAAVRPHFAVESGYVRIERDAGRVDAGPADLHSRRGRVSARS